MAVSEHGAGPGRDPEPARRAPAPLAAAGFTGLVGREAP